VEPAEGPSELAQAGIGFSAASLPRRNLGPGHQTGQALGLVGD